MQTSTALIKNEEIYKERKYSVFIDSHRIFRHFPKVFCTKIAAPMRYKFYIWVCKRCFSHLYTLCINRLP